MMRVKKTMTIAIAAALITATAMLSGCGCDDNKGNNTPTSTVQTTTVEETTVAETAPTLSETDKAITDAGLKVGADGKITDKNGKEVKVDKDGKVEVKNDKGETVKVDAKEVKSANENKKKVENYPTNSPSQKKDTSSSGKSNSSSSSKAETSKSESSKSESSKSQSSKSESSKPSQSSSSSSGKSDTSKSESSKSESSKTDPKPVHTHNWTNITEKVKVVDQEAYSYEEPVYETKGRAICNDCGADITDLGGTGIADHICEHAENGGKGSYRVDDVKVQTGTKTINVPEKSHYETKVIGRKCSGCGKTEMY